MTLALLRQLTSTYNDPNEPQDLAFEVSEMLINARIIKGMTQEELAKKMNTKQSGVARIENGTHLPSLSLLKKIANVYEAHLIPPRFSFMNEDYRPLKVVVIPASIDTSITNYRNSSSSELNLGANWSSNSHTYNGQLETTA